MKKSLPIILCLCLLLSACGAQEQIPGTTNTSQTTNESTVDTSTQNTQESTVDTTEDTTETTEGTTTTEVEPELLYTHPLTGEPLAEMFTARPVGVTINNITDGYNFVESIVSALGCGLGFLLAMVLFSGLRSRIEESQIPESFRGLPVTLIAASFLSLAFFGFAGIVDNLFA